MVQLHSDNQITQLILRPNRSATWLQTKWLLAVLGGLSLIIALAWSFMGAWLILPFAGLEVSLLCVLMYRVCYATYQQQILLFEPTQVRVQLGVYQPQRGWQLARESLMLWVGEPTHEGDPLPLTLTDGSQHVPLGEFLNAEDKHTLVRTLIAQGVPRRHAPKTAMAEF